MDIKSDTYINKSTNIGVSAPLTAPFYQKLSIKKEL
jgi:hypothetical protein